MKNLSGRVNTTTLLATAVAGTLLAEGYRRCGPARLAAVVVVALAARSARRFCRVVVTGHSMEPTLHAGDRLLVRRTKRVRPGDIVVVRDPRGRGARPWVKRVTAVGDLGVEVLGDRPDASTDSRHVGPIPHRLVVGRLVRRYGVADRTSR